MTLEIEILTDGTRQITFPARPEQIIVIDSPGDHLAEVTARSIRTPEEKKHLGDAKVLVIGASTGGELAKILAQQGIGVGEKGGIIIADADTLEVSNLGRLSAGVNDLGQNKAEIVEEKIHGIFPEANIQALAEHITPQNAPALFNDVDIIVDAADGPAKFLARLLAKEMSIPVIMGTNIEGGNQIIDVERFDQNPDLDLFHGRLEPVFGKFDQAFLTKIQQDRTLQQQLIPGLVFVGIGIENLNQPLLDYFVRYLKGEEEGLPQMAASTAITSGAMAQTIERMILGEHTPDRAIIGNTCPDRVEEERKLKYLRDTLETLDRLQAELPKIITEPMKQAMRVNLKTRLQNVAPIREN